MTKESRILRAVLIGCGRMGTTIDEEVKAPTDFKDPRMAYSHAQGYSVVNTVDLVAVSDILPEKVQRTQEKYGVPNGYSDYKKMILLEQPDIVSITTRPGTHAEIAIFSAQNGVKGIYCEKPMACSMTEVDQMVYACQQNGVKFNYGTNRRYQPLFWRMRELIEGGEIGDLQCVVCHCGPSSAQWGHTHMADMMLYLALDADVDYVQANIGATKKDWNNLQISIDPSILMAYAQFENGVRGYHTVGSGYEFEAIGSKGVLRTSSSGKLIYRQFGQATQEIDDIVSDRGTSNCIRDLAESIEQNIETQGGVELAAKSQEMIFGFVDSGRQNGQCVSLPLANRQLYIGPSG